MDDVEKNVSGNITLQKENTSPSFDFKSMVQLPMKITLSSPAAQEWVTQRRENIRPWSVFINTNNFKTPTSLPRLSKRIMKNIEYFQSNYLFVFIGLILYCVLTSPSLLIAVAVSFGAGYIISLRHAERKLVILGHELTLAQQYGIVAACSLPVFYWAGAGAALFWVLGASFLIITLHASFFNVEAVQTPEEERFDLVVEEV